jgi:hypothetical protein
LKYICPKNLRFRKLDFDFCPLWVAVAVGEISYADCLCGLHDKYLRETWRGGTWSYADRENKNSFVGDDFELACETFEGSLRDDKYLSTD